MEVVNNNPQINNSVINNTMSLRSRDTVPHTITDRDRFLKDLDKKIKNLGRNDLYRFAKDSGISDYRKYRRVGEIKEYIKSSLLNRSLRVVNDTALDKLDNTNKLADLKKLVTELDITNYSKFKRVSDLKFYIRSQLDQLPFTNVETSDDVFVPAQSISDSEYNRIFDSSFENDPFASKYYVRNRQFNAIELNVTSSVGTTTATFTIKHNNNEFNDFFAMHDIINKIIAKRKAAVNL